MEKTKQSGGRYDPTRYHGLNLHTYFSKPNKDATIEFRHHSGVLEDIDEAMQWIIFSQFLIELSINNVPEINEVDISNEWMHLIQQIYWNLGHKE